MFSLKLNVFLIAASALFTATGAQAQTASTFQNSCAHIRVAGATISAACRRINGSMNHTSIEIPGIENIDGRLKYTGRSTSNFQNSCSHIHITGSTLSADCRRIDGAVDNTMIAVPFIENIDGVLQYSQ